MEDIHFASLYTRNAYPQNSVCRKYYSITFTSIIRNIFRPERIGYQFEYQPRTSNALSNIEQKKTASRRAERKIIAFIQRNNLKVVYKIQEYAFKSKLWSNSRFRAFILDYSPDIVFSFIESPIEVNLLIKEIIRLKPECKFVGFVADDVYGSAPAEKYKRNIREQIDTASIVYGASSELCNNYTILFNKKISPLYKGCKFKDMKRYLDHESIVIVYAGNLYYGRVSSLIALANTIEKYNSSHLRKIELHIYSNNELSRTEKAILSRKGVTQLYGIRPYVEILRIMQEADIVLHVESFDDEQQRIVRYSFSTKIIDCLQSESVFLCIGPKGIASIEYAKKIPGAIVVDDINNLEAALERIGNTELKELAQLTNCFAKENHTISQTTERLENELRSLVEGSK